RAGKKMTIVVKPEYHVSFTAVQPEQTRYYLGVAVKAIDVTLRAQLPGLPERQGLVVDAVEPRSPPRQAGVKLSDPLSKVGDAPVTDLDSLTARIQATGGKSVPLKVVRAGRPMTITVVPAPRRTTPARVVELKQNQPFTFQSAQPNQPFTF